MGNYSKNPEEPFVVKVPNKIRKRIAMHYTEDSFLKKLESATLLRKILALPVGPVVQKKGSMWSRFANGIKKFWK